MKEKSSSEKVRQDVCEQSGHSLTSFEGKIVCEIRGDGIKLSQVA
jgi:hypothetical protein